MSHLFYLVLLLQVRHPHPNLTHLRISLKHPPLPHVLSEQCIRYKDVDHCLLETDITILGFLQPQWISICIFSVERPSVLAEEVDGDALNSFLDSVLFFFFQYCQMKLQTEEVISLLQFPRLCRRAAKS